MISINQSRFNSPAPKSEQFNIRGGDQNDQQNQLGTEVIARVKKLAVEKPLVIVAAGLAIGVLSGLMLKRR